MAAYKHDIYGGKGVYRNEESLLVPLCIMLSVILGPLSIYWIAIFLKYLVKTYTWSQIIGCAVGGTIVFFILSSIVWSMVCVLFRWWDNLFFGTGLKYDYPSNNTYNTGNNTNNTSYIADKPKTSIFGRKVLNGGGLIAGEREKPPRAEFFGRLNGFPVSSKGKYIERYLNNYEYSYWLKQKEREEARKAGLLDESFEKTDIVA